MDGCFGEVLDLLEGSVADPPIHDEGDIQSHPKRRFAFQLLDLLESRVFPVLIPIVI